MFSAEAAYLLMPALPTTWKQWIVLQHAVLMLPGKKDVPTLLWSYIWSYNPLRHLCICGSLLAKSHATHVYVCDDHKFAPFITLYGRCAGSKWSPELRCIVWHGHSHVKDPREWQSLPRVRHRWVAKLFWVWVFTVCEENVIAVFSHWDSYKVKTVPLPRLLTHIS